MNKIYKEKVDLLLKIIPVLWQEDSLAIHGGTAINLFVKDLPRYSVDIDLTYIPLENREDSLKNINNALGRIADNINNIFKENIRTIIKPEISKLIAEYKGKQIKIEVNQIKRGIIESQPVIMSLSAKAQTEFEVFAKARIVPLSQLYGVKLQLHYQDNIPGICLMSDRWIFPFLM